MIVTAEQIKQSLEIIEETNRILSVEKTESTMEELILKIQKQSGGTNNEK